MSAGSKATITVTVPLEVEVNDRAWALMFGAGDAYHRADAQQRRSLVADVEDYVRQAIADSAAALEAAIVNVDIAAEDPQS